MQSFIGKKDDLFTFMRANDFPVYHLSNMFYRDIEYAIRDYERVHESKDIGGREANRMALELVADLENKGILRPHGRNTWILFDEKYALTKESAPKADGEKSDAEVAE
jgi:hypothetical protein